MYRYLGLLVFVLFFISCGPAAEEAAEVKEPESTVHPFVLPIEKAHRMDMFKRNKAVGYRLDLSFGGKSRFAGYITQTTNYDRILMVEDNGTQMLFDGEKVYLYPDTAMYAKARFDLFTWSYFFAAPYKLSDPGTIWATDKDRELDGTNYPTAKLTFTPGTGDSHEDWYIAYRNPQTNLLDALAYIVTYSKSAGEASADPHAITYEDYKEFRTNIPVATTWKFWGWTEEEGLTKQLGEAKIGSIEFTDVKDSFFRLPEGKVEVPYAGK